MAGPLVSLFTPTHDTRHLDDAYRSLLVQDYTNFEWVITTNGRVTSGHVPSFIRRDPRVRIIPSPRTNKIGELKLHACNQCDGEVFVEFDHDDMLVPGILSKVTEALKSGGGFIHSDVALMTPDMKPMSYNPWTGWEWYALRVYGHYFRASRTFPVSPRSLCEVFYSPDHVRCWSRDAYYHAGGHDPSMSVGDDHELMCRSYISGADFRHVGCCGYIYRFHAGNTVKQRWRKIREYTHANRSKYLHQLVGEWCSRMRIPFVDLGEWMRQDRWRPGECLPIRSGSIGAFKVVGVLEFLTPEQQVPFFNDMYRCLVPGGWACIAVPSENGRMASQDTRHKTRFNLNSFLQYTDRRHTHDEVGCRFQQVELSDFYPTRRHRELDMKMVRCDLAALKGQVWPGKKLI